MTDVLIHLGKLVGEYAVEYSIRILIAALIILVGFKCSKFFANRFTKSRQHYLRDVQAATFIGSILNITFKSVVLISAIAIVGIPVASVIAVLGSAGVAVSLAVQGSLSNLAGGVIILLNKPFKIGDTITVSGSTGVVSGVDLFYTNLITFDNKKILIPNGTMMNAQIENATAFEYRRLDLTFSVSYQSDLETVKKVLLETARACPNVILEATETAAPPYVSLSEHADSALLFLLRVWCRTENYWAVRFYLIENVKKAFDENGISIPFPQVDVHM